MARFRSFDGVEIAYETWGEPGDRPTVVLHHGFAVNAELNWLVTGVIDALVADGRHVVAPDARGHGASGAPLTPDSYGEGTMARDLSLLLDEVGAGDVHLVGYSMGAIVALLAAGQEPRVRRLVLGGVGAGVVEVGGLDTRALAPSQLREALLTEDPTAISSPEVGLFRAFADSVGADRRALAAQAAAVHSRPIDMAAVKVPTLVLVGDADPLAVRPHVLAGAIAGAKLTVVPGDHLTAVTNPAFAPTIVSFLR
jgi:pimeloyl-ACP methyl ester carboxylesterase